MKATSRPSFLYVCLLVTALTGCSRPTKCQTDDQCPLGSMCASGACQIGCNGDSRCPSGEICVTSGRCVADTNRCGRAPPCASGRVCYLDSCVECVTDADCTLGSRRHCDRLVNSCYECYESSDCVAGHVCRSGACIPGCDVDPQCPAGQSCVSSQCTTIVADGGTDGGTDGGADGGTDGGADGGTGRPLGALFVVANHVDGASAALAYQVKADGTLAPLAAALDAGSAGTYSSYLVLGASTAYVINTGRDPVTNKGAICQFGVAPSGLTAGPTTSTGRTPGSGAITADGGYLYVPNLDDGSISAYSVAPSTGNLTALAPTTGLGRPESVAIVGSHLYVADFQSHSIAQYAIAADGTLSPLTPATVNVGTDAPVTVAASPDGKNLYAASGDSSNILQFSFAANGTLSPLSPATADSRGLSAWEIAFDPSGSRAFVTDNLGGQVVLFQRAANGTLSPQGTLVPITTGTPVSGVFDPTGAYFYVFTDQGVLQFAAGASSSLTPLSPPLVSTNGWMLMRGVVAAP